MKTIALVALLLGSSGCATHQVATSDEWCQQISGVDLCAANAPFWAVITVLVFQEEAIRDDFVGKLDARLLETVENRSDRMAWRDENELHVRNLSMFSEIEPDQFISEWRANIALARESKHPDEQHRCLYGTVTSLFNGVVIHTALSDASKNALGPEDLTKIDTGRRDRPRNSPP